MQTRFDLTQADIPDHWYNLLADFPEPLPPPLHPGTKQPVPPEALTAIFPENLVRQEMSPERWIEIPEEVRDIYALWRPTPLLRAVRFEKALQTPAHIYYKYEGASPAGSHKPNTAVPQAYFNKVAGTKRLATETGAGQWGSSLALACKLFGLECNVYMVKVSYQQKPYRRMLMHTWGATVHPSPSDQTEYGRKLLAQDPHCQGSLGHRHQRSHRGHGQASEHEILAGQRAQSRVPPPDGHRPGIHQADGNGRRRAGRDHWLLRRREQFRRPGVSVHPPEDHGKEEIPHRRRRTVRVSVADQRRTALRFRRHGGNHAAC